MISEFTINGTQASKWGLILDEKSLSALIKPVPHKDDIENDSRLQHGVRVVKDASYVRKKKRSVTIYFSIVASSESDFWGKYKAFCDEVLSTGNVNIETKWQSGVVYKFRYSDCDQMTYYNGRLANFSLSLIEPNPDDRGSGEYVELDKRK